MYAFPGKLFYLSLFIIEHMIIGQFFQKSEQKHVGEKMAKSAVAQSYARIRKTDLSPRVPVFIL